MDQRLYEILNDREGNHMLPFLWMHEGHRDELPGLVQQIYDSGARAFCVESRPHEQFCKDEWWGDMDVILAEARKRDMKVWILDDRHFPTGFANGLIPEKYPHLRKWQLIEEHTDMIGPAPQSAMLLGENEEDHLIGVYAYHRSEAAETLDAEPIDLTANVHGRYIYWDVPEGVWRIFALYKSRQGTKQKNYIHMIDPESVHVLIEAVYEPHYEHYAEYFGNTIAGFFSDEPSFGNVQMGEGGDMAGMYNQRLGQPELALPWTDELLERMNQKLGRDAKPLLAGLWYKQGDGIPEVRLAYMDAVTALWREHFSMQLGEWCREHGVEYIGHIIEDMNAHARLSCSGGHYFRSLDGQDMAGIDVVLHQIMPGMAHHVHSAICAGGMTDPEFFDYMLARLAASHSHLQPRMKNRAMCEVFGAYGWAEGVPFMRKLMDHMLVRGINHFVPHAFSPKYPDPDCPPHFGGGGDNPEFSAFAKLMRYSNKVAHLLEGGTEIVSAGILYHAEAEWSGRDYMLTQKPAKRLYDAQLNYDILPIDALMDRAFVEDGMLRIGDMRYPALIIPYAAYLPEAFLVRLAELEAQGAKLAFIDGRPEGCVCGSVISLDQTVDYVREAGGTDLKLAEPFPLLRFSHVKRDSCDVFMLVNESLTADFDGNVHLPVSGKGVLLRLLRDNIFAVDAENGMLRVKLRRGESAMLFFGDDSWKDIPTEFKPEREILLENEWTLTVKAAHGWPCDEQPKRLAKLYNVTGPDGDPTFSGRMRYETVFTPEPGAAMLDLGLVGECAHVWLNGIDLGERIDAPYCYNITEAVREGENRLTVEVTNSLVFQNPDWFSQYMQISPSGLLGPVKYLIG